jgi:outer membrane protein insertion porin family
MAIEWMRKISDLVRLLFKSGNFEDVVAERDGDVLIFKVTERPAIATIKLEATKRLIPIP